MTHRTTTLIVTLFGCLCCRSPAVPPPATDASIPSSAVIDRDSLLADFDLMRVALEIAHPRLHHYKPAAIVTRGFDEVRARIDRPMTAAEFYRLAVEAVAVIGDGHTQLQPAPEATATLVAPVELYVAGGRAWVMAAHHSSAPPPGSEILAINGTPIAEVLETAARRIPRDWDLASGRRADLSDRFAEYYADLVVAPREYQFVIQKGDEETVVTTPAIPRDTARILRRMERDTMPIAWRLLDTTTAYVDLNSFNDGNFEHVGSAFRSAFDSAMAFVRSRRPRSLILDIRQNGGGESSNGAYAASYLLDRPFSYLTAVVAIADDLPVIEHTQWAGDPDAQGEYREILKRRPDGRFDVVAPWYSTAVVRPQAWTFPGRVYLLTDGFDASTGSDFAAILHAKGRATFVGEMMGGSYDGNASGLAARIRLPASGVTLRLPLFDFELASGAPPHPSGAFPPDLEVLPSAAALLRGEDPALAAAMALAVAEREVGAPIGRRLTEYFGALASNRDFQGVVLVRSAGQPLYARPFGFSALGASRPHDLESRFGIASLTKTFTAAAILRLRDRGVLTLADSLSAFIPEFPNGGAITLLQLLRHEAGLRDPPESPPEDTLSVPSSEALVAAIAAEPPYFPPGTDDRYSNAGYTVLARAVEIASGLEFDRFLRNEFWSPLGMRETGDRRALTTEAGLARPYFPGPPPAWLDLLPSKQALTALGSGSLYSTAADLARWGIAVASGDTVRMAGESYPYGWGRTTVEGRSGYIQTGLTTGYASSLQVFPEADRIIAVLSNVEHGSWTDWATDAARIVFGAEGVTPTPPRVGTPLAIDSVAAHRYAGRFRMNATRFVDVSYEDGHLWLRLNGYHRRHYMMPTGVGAFTFRSFSGTVRFEPRGRGEPAPGFTWTLPASWNQPDEVYQRVAH